MHELFDDEPLFYTNSVHPFDRSCQCKRCVKLHTLTMQDREFLRTMGIAWTAEQKRRVTKSTPTPSTRATRKA